MIIALVPARAGSKRLPGKNHKKLGGKPLFLYSVDYAKKSNFIDKIVVSTDDNLVIKICQQNSIDYIVRPEELSADESSTSEVLIHAVEALKLMSQDLIITLQPTNPFREQIDLSSAITEFTHSTYSSLITCHAIKQKLSIISDGVLSPINYHFGQRGQDIEPVFKENGILYISRVASLMEDGNMFGVNPMAYVVDANRAIDIDTIEDFIEAEERLKKTI